MTQKNINKVYAVKIISKHKVLSTQQQQHLFNEVKYMSRLKHRMICQMRGVAQDNRNLYVLMDFLQHGELLNVLKKVQRMDAPLAQFYTAQIVLIFEYLHGQDIIYRDLKPENVLLCDNGYVKLTDFGFVKRIKPWERTYTLCGTPEYIAPEVLMNVGHGRAADWYTLGIFLYELMVGRPPFMHQDTYEVFKMTLRERIPYPSWLPESAKSIIKHLTKHDLSKRFGNLLNGSKDIRNHRFFKGVNFAELESQKVSPPYMPPIKNSKLSELLRKGGQKHSEIPETTDESIA